MKGLRRVRSVSGARNGPIFPWQARTSMTLTPGTLLDACVKIRRVLLQAARVRWGTYSHSRFLRDHVVGMKGELEHGSNTDLRDAREHLSRYYGDQRPALSLGVGRGNTLRILWGIPPPQTSCTAVCNVGITPPPQGKQKTKNPRCGRQAAFKHAGRTSGRVCRGDGRRLPLQRTSRRRQRPNSSLNTRDRRRTGLKFIELRARSPTLERLCQGTARSLNIKVRGSRAQFH